MVTVRITAPTMWLATLIASMVVEEPWNIGGTVYGEDIGKALETLAVAVVGGGIAVMMILCEFSLILKSTAVVLMIGGVLKEVFTIVLGVAIFGDKLTGRNLAGFAIVLFGVAVFKTRHMGEGEEEGERGFGGDVWA
jgi:solute carrier family 35, member C2